MSNLTYKQLADIINNMSAEQQNQTVTIYVPGEVDGYFPTCIVYTDEDCDVLDPGHPVLLTLN